MCFLCFRTEMDSGIDRGGSTSPNPSSGNASMENFDERPQDDLEDGKIPGSRSQSDLVVSPSPPAVNSTSVVGTAAKRTTEEGEEGSERKEAAPVEGPRPGGDDAQRNTMVVLSDGLPEVIIGCDSKRTKGRPKSPSRKTPSGGGGGGKPDATDEDPGRSIPGPAARLVDRVALGLGLCHSVWIDRIAKVQEAAHGCLQTNHRYIVRGVGVVSTVVFAVYFCFAVATTGARRTRVLIGITAFVVFVCVCLLVSRVFGQRMDSLICAPIRGVTHTRPCLCIKW